ncbi:cyclic AMP-dependent transcription factor ATF-6 alpha [Dendroctonus ponderosae]
MLPEGINLIEDYGFRSSPESCSDKSFSSTDLADSMSEEDFMTQLSSSLDIPLLLNAGEDEMAVLNSFLDKSPDEILSEIKDSPVRLFDDDLEGKEFDFFVDKPPDQPPACPMNDPSYFNYFHSLNGALAEHLVNIDDDIGLKSELHSEESCSSTNSIEPSTPPPVIAKRANPPTFFSTDVTANKISQAPMRTVKPSTIQVVPQAKLPIKRVPIKPKYTLPTKGSNIVLIKNVKNEFANKASQNIVLLDSIPVNNFNSLAPVTVNIPNSSICSRNNTELDPRVLKRQERRIKNRESASISRKKKKDYLNSLEEQVKQLSAKNARLEQENSSLKQRLAFFESAGNCRFSMAKRAKPALFLCAVLLLVGFNFNLARIFEVKTAKSGDTNYPKLPDHFSRNLLWADEDSMNNLNLNRTYFSSLTMCPASINQTESARLLLELERWIGKPKVTKAPVRAAAKPASKKAHIKRKKLRLDSSLAQYRGSNGAQNDMKTELEVFSPRLDQLYSEFYQAINRRDDTFYVVSFSEQHMLLPALYHNNTRRPKMSLLMPSMFHNETSTQTYVQLMQIDCEVLDTKLVNVKYGTIPRPYRHYGNSSHRTEASGRRADNISTVKKYDPRGTYKPYVLSKNLLKGTDDSE